MGFLGGVTLGFFLNRDNLKTIEVMTKKNDIRNQLAPFDLCASF